MHHIDQSSINQFRNLKIPEIWNSGVADQLIDEFWKLVKYVILEITNILFGNHICSFISMTSYALMFEGHLCTYFFVIYTNSFRSCTHVYLYTMLMLIKCYVIVIIFYTEQPY